MTVLHRLYDEFGQSPWLDNLSRDYLLDGTLARYVAGGIRGVTANPTIFARAIERSDAYDKQFAALIAAGHTVDTAYWELVRTDVRHAAELLRPLYEASTGGDGFVSVEVAPELANDTNGTVEAARDLHDTLRAPNVMVKIPVTAAGIPAVRAMTAAGRSINITLIFSLARYAEVAEAFLSGLEERAATGEPLSGVHSVASFFVSRVDTDIDRRLEKVGTAQALALRGRAAVAQARCAYQLFRRSFSGPRWERLASLGASIQRPLWASTSTKNRAYRDTLYAEELVGPLSVNTLQETTIAALEDHGRLRRLVDSEPEEAEAVIEELRAVFGIDLGEIGLQLEQKSVADFHTSFAHVLGALSQKAEALTGWS